MQVRATFFIQAKDRLDNQVRVLVKNSSWLLSANAFRALLSIIRSVIVARSLGLELYGSYVIVVESVSTVQNVFDTTIGTTIIKFGADFKSEQRIDKLIALVKISGIIVLGSSLFTVATIAVIAFTVYGVFLEVPGLEKYLILYAVAVAFAPFDYISGSMLRLYDRFRLNALISIIAAIFEVSCIAIVSFMYPGNIGLFFYVLLVTGIMTSLITNLAAFFELRAHLQSQFHAGIGLLRENRRELFNFVISNSGSRTIKTLIDRGDIILLGVLSSTSAAGSTRSVKNWRIVLLRFSDPLFNAIYPQVAALAAERRFREMRQFVVKLSRSSAYIGVACIVVALLIGEWSIVALYGKEYSEATWLFILHLIVTVSTFVFFWGLPVLLSLGMVNVRFVVNLFGLIVGGGLAVWLTSLYGAIGMAFSVVVAKLLITYSYTFISYRHIK